MTPVVLTWTVASRRAESSFECLHQCLSSLNYFLVMGKRHVLVAFELCLIGFQLVGQVTDVVNAIVQIKW